MVMPVMLILSFGSGLAFWGRFCCGFGPGGGAGLWPFGLGCPSGAGPGCRGGPGAGPDDIGLEPGGPGGRIGRLCRAGLSGALGPT